MSNLDTALAELAAAGIYELAHAGNIATPDDVTSPGAEYLDTVRSVVIEAVEVNPNGALDEWEAYVTQVLDGCHYLIYTHSTWRVFMDLRAYEDEAQDYAADLGYDARDMTHAAAVVVLLMGERLASALLVDLDEARQ
jgi:hypothetical protein